MNRYCFFIAASWGDAAVPDHFKALAQRLVERGHCVVYLPHGQHVRIDEGDFHVYSFPSPRPTRLRDFLFLHKLVRKYKPDCMIANFGAVNVMTIVGWLNRVPYRVAWYHSVSKAFDLLGTNWKKKLLVLRKRLTYGLCTQIVSVSNATRNDLLSTYKVDPQKCHVFYNCLADPLDSTRKAKTKESTQQILTCVGGLNPWKGQDILLRALALLKDEFPHIQLELLGKGRLEANYRQLAADLGLKERVIFRGAVSHNQVLRAMASSAMTIVPSRSEAFGLVNIESMSVGTPVIATSVGGIPEIVRDGVDGFLVPPDDPEALAEKIRLLLTDHVLRAQMGKNARQRFLDMFEQTKNIERQVLWFEELVQKHRSDS